MSKEKSKTLLEILDNGTFEEVLDKLFQLKKDAIKTVGVPCLKKFLIKYSDYAKRESFTKTMLDKVNNFEGPDQPEVTDFTFLRALCLATRGKDTFANQQTQETKDIKFLRHERALDSLEAASKLYQSLLKNQNTSKEYKTYFQNEKEIQKLITKMIVEYGDLEEGLKLADLSSKLRKESFGVKHPNTLQALLLRSELGAKSVIPDTQIKCLNDAELAYNTICEDTIKVENVDKVKKLLAHMSTLYSIFGDKGKARELSSEILFLTQRLESPSPNDVKDPSAKTIEVLEERTLILKKGFTNAATLKVKHLLQEKVLDPIQAAAAKAKWHEEWGLAGYTANYGVAGYVDEKFLKTVLDKDYNPANYKIALGLCFEAINIGIMSNSDQNPLVAAIFCEKYPTHIKDILKDHPEYFVDGHILQTTLLNLNEYSKTLLRQENVPVNGGYNKLFESAIIPFVKEKIESTVLTPLKNLVTSDGWTLWHTNELKEYLSDDFLLKGSLRKYSALGNNLSLIPDVINIARILAFETLAKAITEKFITNLTPIEIFITTFPNLNVRIIEDHPEYLSNNFIFKLCNNWKIQTQANVASENFDPYKSILPSQQEGESNLLGDAQNPNAELEDLI